jgi:hypothetical protein
LATETRKIAKTVEIEEELLEEYGLERIKELEAKVEDLERRLYTANSQVTMLQKKGHDADDLQRACIDFVERLYYYGIIARRDIDADY